jgi:hypothetical protein
MKVAALAMIALVLAGTSISAQAISPPVPRATLERMVRLSAALQSVAAFLQLSTPGMLGIVGRSASVFSERRAEAQNYLRTVSAQVEVTHDSPNLVNMFNMATAFTGFEYDIETLIALGRVQRGGKSQRWAKQLRDLMAEVSLIGNACSDDFESYMRNVDLAARGSR